MKVILVIIGLILAADGELQGRLVGLNTLFRTETVANLRHRRATSSGEVFLYQKVLMDPNNGKMQYLASAPDTFMELYAS